MPPQQQNPISKTLIAFDKDGVLLNLTKTWLPFINAIAKYLEETSNGVARAETLLESIGVTINHDGTDGNIDEDGIFAAGTVGNITNAWLLKAPTLSSILSSNAFQTHVSNIKVKAVAKGNVLATLTRLKEKGYSLAVATNDNEASTKRNLEDMGIDAMFSSVICADSGFGGKPQAGGLLEACRANACSPDKAIMVGDTIADWEAARNANFKHFIAITDLAPDLPAFIPDAYAALPTIEGLPDILDEMLERQNAEH